MSDLKPIISRLADGHVLSEAEAEQAFEAIMSGAVSPAQIAAFLMALRVRGEAVSELTGAARIMRAKALKVTTPDTAIDTVGTGGDTSGSYNISTAVAFVVAGCGVPVAKHGNRAVSSKSGAADVLAALGVNLDAPVEAIERAIREAGVGFLFAQKHHSAMKHVAPVRAELGVRTIFNLVGPLSNPASAKRQLLGVFARKWLVPMAETLARLGSTRAWVVHGSDGLDEITTTGATFVAELSGGAVRSFEVTPEQAGLARTDPNSLKGGDAHHNAKALRGVLAGEPGPYRDIVLLNSAAALIISERATDLKYGVALAAKSIAEGRSAEALRKLVAISNGTP
ncbi:MAG: anthranilate phosphoribosyltransferase [Alphaproteobacteria bacterium]|nr:anthranilate phosphoribosyltransferase [Alphaproteobacteria bacterium]